MSNTEWKRRDFIRTVMGAMTVGVLDWDSLPIGQAATLPEGHFDAVIIGSGLGGLSCAAAFARQGFKPLVLEQHDKPGGYATRFTRPGGFEFDVSLHSTGVGERNGVHNLIPGFPEITDVEFVPHPTLYRAIFPNHDIRVPNRNLPAYIDTLTKSFPAEAEGIKALFEDMKGVTQDILGLSSKKGNVDMMHFPQDYPYLFRFSGSTWGQIVDSRIKDPKLKAVISSLWGYFGLPPSKLASIYYGLPTYSYLTGGGFYPKGRSQTISNALVSFIEARGGKVLLSNRVTKILMKDETAYGVSTADGHEYKGKVVVSNANAYDTFHTLLDKDEHLKDYLARMDTFSVSLSSFQIFLGLKRDLVREAGLTDTEIFYDPGYDIEASYEGARKADFSNPGFCITLYDNLYPGYSPKGKNTVSLLTLQGFDHWKLYESDYWKGNKAAYRAEKERMANLLIRQAEKIILPGLSKAIEVQEIGTPLTNVRYTGNYRGAIYGWDQTLDNSNPRRLPHTTPIKNLYLAGAWTAPGHGYGAVIPSGLECFGEIMKHWT
ncbi:MAG: NAD(P)/FAD-dependent oxidoreductase [Acidobacteriia bacterium]|nr:NAD(P)/FAD-dependent oxidoreductase [Terriglobia bacterium]